MRVGIMGAGTIGGEVTRRLRASGHESRSSSHGRETLVERDRAAREGVVAPTAEGCLDRVEARSRKEAWRQQPGSPVEAGEPDRTGTAAALRQESLERQPPLRARGQNPASYSDPR